LEAPLRDDLLDPALVFGRLPEKPPHRVAVLRVAVQWKGGRRPPYPATRLPGC